MAIFAEITKSTLSPDEELSAANTALVEAHGRKVQSDRDRLKALAAIIDEESGARYWSVFKASLLDGHALSEAQLRVSRAELRLAEIDFGEA